MRGRRRSAGGDFWPGYVDALASLLLVIMFLLSVYMLAQFFLGQALSGRDKALAELNDQMTEIADMLALERRQKDELARNVAALRATLGETQAARDAAQSARDALRQDLNASETARAALQSDLDATRDDLDATRTARDALRQDLDSATAERDAIAAARDAVAGDRDKLARVGAELAARLDDAEQARRDLAAAAQNEAARLNEQIAELRKQLGEIQGALDAAEAKTEAQKTTIADLGARLNRALAQKVGELSRYRSEFFGRVRDILGNREGIQIKGDRFVLQSEVLFDSGAADLNPDGFEELNSIAAVLLDIVKDMPDDIDWVLRVDGHTDARPIATPQYPSNWELSAARAISVARFLIERGVPRERLAPTGFADTRPLVAGDTTEAYAANRRIEFKLTER